MATRYQGSGCDRGLDYLAGDAGAFVGLELGWRMKVGAISATTRPTTIIGGNQSNWISAHRLNTT